MSDFFDASGHAVSGGTIMVYGYDQDGVYVSGSEIYIPQGVGLPANSTNVAPPDPQTGFARVFDPVSQAWSQVEDHRGAVYYLLKTGQTVTITVLGPVDATKYSATPPTPPVQSLAQQAATALVAARTYVNDNYVFLAETPPADWVAYQKALIAISTGKDTTSTTLPTAPAS